MYPVVMGADTPFLPHMSNCKKFIGLIVFCQQNLYNMIKEDKGWESEESLLADMAAFRRERMGL